MGVNITVDGSTYSGVEQMYVGGKSLALEAVNDQPTLDAFLDGQVVNAYGSASYIRNYAFSAYSALMTAEFPNVTTISSYAFTMCSNLSFASFPGCILVGNGAFSRCSALSDIYFPEAKVIEDNAFNSTALSEANFPMCSSVYYGAFQSCPVTHVSMPNLIELRQIAFGGCSLISELSFPKLLHISRYGFANMHSLMSVYLMGSSVPIADIRPFDGTPIADSSYTGAFGSVYVPSSLLTIYQSATNWVLYSERFVGV